MPLNLKPFHGPTMMTTTSTCRADDDDDDSHYSGLPRLPDAGRDAGTRSTECCAVVLRGMLCAAGEGGWHLHGNNPSCRCKLQVLRPTRVTSTTVTDGLAPECFV